MFHCYWCGEMTLYYEVDYYSKALCPDCMETPEFIAIMEKTWTIVRLLEEGENASQE